MSKPKVGFYWCASCGGCEEAVVDLAEAVLDVVAAGRHRLLALCHGLQTRGRRGDGRRRDGRLFRQRRRFAPRSSAKWSSCCRRKAQLLVAFGSCSHMGGIPGLANLVTREEILETVYGRSRLQHRQPVRVSAADPHRSLRRYVGITVPSTSTVKTLDQVVTVDYYLPGCAPPVKLIVDAVMAIVKGELPPRGSVLAPDIALCSDCPRLESKPDESLIERYRRPHEVLIDPEKCFLAQGLICMGPATRCRM